MHNLQHENAFKATPTLMNNGKVSLGSLRRVKVCTLNQEQMLNNSNFTLELKKIKTFTLAYGGGNDISIGS